MARRTKKKHREHTRKPLSDARKQELFAQILAHAGAEIGKPSPLVEADEEDRESMREDDASDAPEVSEPETFKSWFAGVFAELFGRRR